MTSIGVVIPTLNEAARLPATIHALRRGGVPAVVVVADCSSTDGTVDTARRLGVHALDGAGDTRAGAMNAGGRWIIAHDPAVRVLFFLHADSIVPTGWDDVIVRTFERLDVVAGAFGFAWKMDEAPWWMRPSLHAVAMINRTRLRLSGAFFGDQGLFVRTEAFTEAGGFPDCALLEDVRMCRRLRRVGRLKLVAEIMVTSPRRFVRHGVVKQLTMDAMLLASDAVGIELPTVHGWYNRQRE